MREESTFPPFSPKGENFPQLPRFLQVVYPSNRYLTAKVRAFADFVAESVPQAIFR